MSRLFRLLRSPRLAVVVLVLLAAYGGVAAWLPWSSRGVRVPTWAAVLGLDRPFSSPAFLLAVGLLFLSTLACLWDRTAGTWRLWRGGGEAWGAPFPSRQGIDFERFLAEEGFRGRCGALFRYRHALWGVWVLHLGLVVLIAGVAVQQGFHDSGAFELSEGERLSLAAPAAVFARERGLFAAEVPPDVVLGLVSFDPFLHQPGYAPDRASRLRVEPRGRAPSEVVLDRAEGVSAGPVTLYQAIPNGLSLNIEVGGLGARSFHLRARSPLTAEGEFTAPGGETVRLGLTGGRAFDDPQGTGPLRAWMDRSGTRVDLAPGVAVPFGQTTARLVSIGRWAGFTYARSPGLPAVFTGFALVLLGAALLTFPAGVAWPAPTGGGSAGRVFVTRGRDWLLAEWARQAHNPARKED